MTHHAFSLAGAALTARASGALWWEAARLLAVSDLHLGKAGRLARAGGPMLPPYETRETLARLDAEVSALAPRVVICLGDSFDDLASAAALDESERATLARLMAGRRWIWIAGNHDPAPVEIAGECRAEVAHGPLTFRHIAVPDAAPGEVSGHHHPKARIAQASRPCFLVDARRAILPAFGAYTGGMDVARAPLSALIAPDGLAVLTGRRAIPAPVAALR